MFAFKLKPEALQHLSTMFDLSDVVLDENVTHYAIVDIDTGQKIVDEEGLRALEAAEGEEYIIFE